MTRNPSAVALGDRAGYTTDGDVAIRVPPPHGAQYPTLLTPFERVAADYLAEMRKLLRRLRSQQLFTSAFEDTSDWTCTKQKIRVIGEVWGYGEFELTRAGGTLEVPPDGDLPSETVGTISVEAVRPQSLARLVSVNTGVLATGYALANGTVKLAALNTGQNIANGDIITLAGMWPLDDWFDSEA